MFNLKELYSNTENPNMESGLDTISDSVVGMVEAVADEEATLVQLESALEMLDAIESGEKAIESVESVATTLKEQVDNGVTTFETALTAMNDINSSLGKIGYEVKDFLGDNISLESAQNFPNALANSIVDTFYTTEAAEDAEKSKGAWNKFKNWVLELFKKFKEKLSVIWNNILNLFKSHDTIIANLIKEAEGKNPDEKVEKEKYPKQSEISPFIAKYNDGRKESYSNIIKLILNNGKAIDSYIKLVKDIPAWYPKERNEANLKVIKDKQINSLKLEEAFKIDRAFVKSLGITAPEGNTLPVVQISENRLTEVVTKRDGLFDVVTYKYNFSDKNQKPMNVLNLSEVIELLTNLKDVNSESKKILDSIKGNIFMWKVDNAPVDQFKEEIKNSIWLVQKLTLSYLLNRGKMVKTVYTALGKNIKVYKNK